MPPTQYKPSNCNAIVKMAKEGLLPHQWARKFNKSINTLYNWKRTRPEFNEAWEKAMTFHVAYLMDMFQDNPRGNYKVVDFALRRFHHMTDETEEEKKNKGVNITVDFGDNDETS